MSISTIVFDAYKTLIDIQTDEDRLEVYEFISSWLSYKGLEIEPQILFKLYKEKVRQEIASNTEAYPDIDIGIVFKRIISSIDRTYNFEMEMLIEEICLLFRMLTTKSIRIYPNTVSILECLSKKFRLAIVSNTQRLFTLPELKKFHIEEYFECIVFSSDVKASKPNPKIFKKLLSCMKIQPDDAIFVGDNMFDDIWGAQRVGMKTIWINRSGSSNFPSGLEKPIPDKQISGNFDHDLPNIIFSMI